MAEGEGDSEAQWHTDILEAYEGFDEGFLSNPAKELLLLVPSRHPNPKSFPQIFFHAVGRKSFSKLLNFTRELMEPPKVPKLSETADESVKKIAFWAQGVVERFLGQKAYVIGTPGEGKSYLLAMLAGFLHNEGKWVVAYLSAARLSYDVLRSSLKVALARDSAALSQMETIPDTQLLEWLNSRPEMLFLVDDYNELDLQRQTHQVWEDVEFWKESLHTLSERHTVVLCCSCRSSMRKELARDSGVPCLVLAGGFSKEELETFERTFVNEPPLPKEVLYRTGRNPRLLRLYVQGEGRLDKELRQLRESLKKFMKDLSAIDRDKFVAQLAGAFVVESLPKAMDSRCFYVGESGELEAICEELKSVALNICLQQAKNLEKNKLEEHIRLYIECLSTTNMARTGWNAEEATLLALGGFPVVINLIEDVWNFQAELIKTFSGGIRGVIQCLEGSGEQILHVPVEFNCEAVDCVMEGTVAGKKVVAGVQVSVSQKPQGSHVGAKARFCQVLQDTGLRFELVVFIWVGYFPKNRRPQIVKVGEQDVVEVTMTFNSVHRSLSRVDVICGLAARQKDQCLGTLNLPKGMKRRRGCT